MGKFHGVLDIGFAKGDIVRVADGEHLAHAHLDQAPAFRQVVVALVGQPDHGAERAQRRQQHHLAPEIEADIGTDPSLDATLAGEFGEFLQSFTLAAAQFADNNRIQGVVLDHARRGNLAVDHTDAANGARLAEQAGDDARRIDAVL